MNTENLQVRTAILKSGLRYQKVAELMGIKPQSFSRLLRNPLSDKWKENIFRVLSEEQERRKGETKEDYPELTRLKTLIELKSYTRQQTAKLFRISTKELNDILDHPNKEYRPLVNYFIGQLSQE